MALPQRNLQLTKYANDTRPILEDLDKAMAEYRLRFSEIEKALNTPEYPYVRSIPYISSQLIEELTQWSGQPHALRTIENTKTFDGFDKSIHSVQPWMEKSRQDLAALRQQYASAQVYDDAHGNQPRVAQPSQRTGAAVHISPNAVDSGMDSVRIQGFDNAVLDDGKSSRMKNLDIKK
jgi:hypothetical protein